MNWKFWKKKLKYKFPCSSDKCLIRAGCTQTCDKIITDENELKNFFTEFELCPDCGSKYFYRGSKGGMSQNIKCAGCGHWFNVSLPYFFQRIHFFNRRFLN